MKSFRRACYLLSIVDDATRGVSAYPVKEKSEASQIAKNFCFMVNTCLILEWKSLEVTMVMTST